MHDDYDRELLARRVGTDGAGWIRSSFFAVLLSCILGGTDWCYAADASSVCEEESGIKVGLGVVAISVESIKFKLSMRNVSAKDIEVSRELVPWFNPGRVSVMLLDWRSDGSLEQWVADSRIKFSFAGHHVGAFFTRRVREFIASVDGVLKPGVSVTSDVEFSVSPSGFSLSASDIERLRREGVFLWSARMKGRGVDCLQSGISDVK